MPPTSLIAVFATKDEAANARTALIDQGFDPGNLALSIELTSDAIAAEVPGQAFANETSKPAGGVLRSITLALSGKSDEDSADAARMADVQRGNCVLTVSETSSERLERASSILEQRRPVTIRID
jgi:hypothetical protein